MCYRPISLERQKQTVQVICQDDRPAEDTEKEHMDTTFKFLLVTCTATKRDIRTLPVYMCYLTMLSTAEIV
jgi:hypothetical protein